MAMKTYLVYYEKFSLWLCRNFLMLMSVLHHAKVRFFPELRKFQVIIFCFFPHDFLPLELITYSLLTHDILISAFHLNRKLLLL
jgi:hypothetical protein